MIRTCIIGVSGYGEIHYNLLQKAAKEGKAEIAGAAIINQEDEAEKCATLRSMGCGIYEDYKEMLQSLSGSADLCMIPTGIPLHKPMSIAALEAGMSVLVEKPAAGSVQDVLAMIETERNSGKKAAVGFQHMYGQSAQKSKEKILKGEIGRIRLIKVRILWPRNADYYSRNSWAGALKTGDTWILDSPINNATAHYLMMMLFFAGCDQQSAAAPVSIEAELYRANNIESADTASLRIDTDAGIPLLMSVTHACSETVHPEVRVCGEKGEILWHHEGSEIIRDGASEEIAEQGDVHGRMMDAALSLAKGDDEYYCSLNTALKHNLAVNGAHEASAIHSVKETAEKDGCTFIPGIESVIEKAFNEEKLFSELDVSWTRPAGSFNLEGFKEFTGKRLA